jgi:2-keto-4-pentenoate hydratase/2-oxohepta-3-ene-1,7-dioic acid hydratase in catechol pathway
MRLVAFRAEGRRWMGALGPEGRVAHLTDVATFYADVEGALAVARHSSPGLSRLRELQLEPPVPAGARVFCVGLNYRAHAEEGGHEVPAHPTLFGRWFGSLSVDGAPVPAVEPRLDWEGELAVVIGRRAARVSEADAMDCVFAYAPFNDISARTYQRHTPQWTLGKNADGSGPLGALVTLDEVGDTTGGLRLTTRVNGTLVQSASTAEMIYSIPRVVSYISEIVTLEPGDVIATGTPEGVGHARKPPVFMQPGDVVEVEIERVGRITNLITSREEYEAWKARRTDGPD